MEAPPRKHDTDPRKRIEILDRDPAYVVVAKPSGLAVHRGLDRGSEFLMTRVRDQLGQWVFPVHRLDRATSGALIFALDREVARTFQEAFEGQRVEKRYLALVRGVTPAGGTIDHPLRRSGKTGERVPAVTHFRRLGVFERFSLVEVHPETGRFHQIRRHFKHLSHPLVGDVRYGKGPINRDFRTRFGLHRLALHALELAFDHPIEGDRRVVRCPVPDDLANPLRAMNLTPEPGHLEGVPLEHRCANMSAKSID